MSKYHAASKYGKPLCGSRSLDGFKTVAVPAKDWNQMRQDLRCAKCALALTKRPLASLDKDAGKHHQLTEL